jgi:hypothetical protein
MRHQLNLAWMLAFEPQNCRTATDGAPEPLVLLSAAVAVRGTSEVSTLRRVVLRRPHSVATPSREVGRSWCRRLAAPLFAEPRENPSTRRRAARWRRAEPCVLELRPTSRDFLPFVVVRVCPGRLHPSGPRPRPRRGDARRVGLRRRVVRSVWNFWKPAVEPWCFSLQVWVGGSPESSAPQLLGPESPRHRANTVAVASPYPGATRYASRHRLPWSSYWLKAAVQRKGLEATHSLAPQRIEGTPPAVGELAGARTRRAVAGLPGNSSSTWYACVP